MYRTTSGSFRWATSACASRARSARSVTTPSVSSGRPRRQSGTVPDVALTGDGESCSDTMASRSWQSLLRGEVVVRAFEVAPAHRRRRDVQPFEVAPHHALCVDRFREASPLDVRSERFAEQAVAPDDAIAPDRGVAFVPHRAVPPHDAVSPHHAIAPHDALRPRGIVGVDLVAPHDAVAPDDALPPCER